MNPAHSLDALKTSLPIATAVVGLIGALTTLSKALISLLTDRSLERRARKHMQAISESLARLADFQQVQPAVLQLDVVPYRAQLIDDLQRESGKLAAVRERQNQREKLKTRDPAGYRRWFLVFRPNGIAGWIIHSLFYGFALGFVGMLLLLMVSPPKQYLLGAMLSVLELGLPAVYFRSAALRRRHLRVLLMRDMPSNGPQAPIGGKAWIKRLLLLEPVPIRVFQKAAAAQWPTDEPGTDASAKFNRERLAARLDEGGASFLKMLYYGAVVCSGMTLYVMLWPRPDVPRFFVGFLIMTIMFSFIAIALGSDALTIQQLSQFRLADGGISRKAMPGARARGA